MPAAALGGPRVVRSRAAPPPVDRAVEDARRRATVFCYARVTMADPEATATCTLTVSVFRRDRQVNVARLSAPALKIGTDPRSQLVLDDPAARRMHAVVEMDDAGATLIDLGTDVGTWVNGARINRVRLQPGDEIRIGTTTIQVVSVDAAR